MAKVPPPECFLMPVVYVGNLKEKVESFNKLPLSSKKGKLWDSTDDGDMEDVKKFIKDHYKIAQNYRCPYCQQKIEVEHNGSWDAEHIIPKDTHPQFMFEPRNLCVSCKDCNLIKLNKRVLKNQKRVTFPDAADDYLFCHPHYHSYFDHVNIIEEAGFYLPKTRHGVHLVEICGLLRFVLKYADCEWDDDQICLQVQSLGDELVSTKEPEARIAIMSMMKTLLDDGIRKATYAGIKARVERFAMSAG